MFFLQVHLLSLLLPLMLMIKHMGTVPSLYIAFYRDNPISLWILKMVSQTQQDLLDAVSNVMQVYKQISCAAQVGACEN